MPNAIKKGANIIPLPENLTGQEKATNVNDVLSNMLKKKPAPKSKVPIINDEDLYEDVDNIIASHKELKNALATHELNCQILLSKGKEEYENTNGLTATFKFQGKEGAVSVGFTNRFKEISLENKDKLVEACGDSYDRFFTDSYEISMIDTSISSIEKLIDKIGADMFQELFEIKKSVIKVASDMNTAQFTLPEGAKPYVEQYKGSVKVA